MFSVAGGNVPAVDLAGPSGRNQGLVVRGEGHGQDAMTVHFERAGGLARGDIEESHRATAHASRGDVFAV